ncbi:hypothetical protein NDU88_003754 [Pleurodeles waltl]|uniref:Uncharacterized protein n=1 Tax=Pleurodeles waltl TaxID=8319 RepID=A0AAV7WSJ2_PLEWA|nr:hypothetical protein NDU88_003754 [Pleurodeles waltl]
MVVVVGLGVVWDWMCYDRRGQPGCARAPARRRINRRRDLAGTAAWEAGLFSMVLKISPSAWGNLGVGINKWRQPPSLGTAPNAGQTLSPGGFTSARDRLSRRMPALRPDLRIIHSTVVV